MFKKHNLFSIATLLAVLLIVAQMPFAAAQAPKSALAQSDQPSCGTEPVTLNAYFETGFDIPFKLAEEFTNQYPNVTWDIKQDQFTNLINSTPRLLAGDNPPDLIRLPTMVSFAEQGLLKNLDDYAAAFGWDEWPVPQLNQNRVAEDGTRGSGSLYAMGLNYSLTGIFYNKELATQIGMTEPPATLAELDELLAAAKDAGLLPIMQWGSAKSGMGLAFPLQALMASVGPVEPINDWIFQKPGATIDTESNLVAAEHLQQWIENGYFPSDINAIEYTDANARFGQGEGVFIFNGDWQNAGYDTDMPGNIGFFLMPPAEEGGSPAAMSAPLTYGIAANAVNADCAAFFLNWVATDDAARQINVEIGGSNPGGPSGLEMPAVTEGSVTNETLAAGVVVGEAGTSMDFIANSTSAIFAQGWTPELQKMVGGRQDAAGLLEAVQAEYELELSE
ncbi:MAG TPA: extracellular solute-binding protein [Aggregatilinea sp.]|uniref:ABC transporter substrate-binding protein n=1 Tax=Aggregatilinea sp. TaxID=2806333 RepID=UPI002B5C5545|nr:extracellular solute-binding protein [Aggregatilinea sp.]HML20932.1 extracellular solute-binding protein [Aggregatilinea sp.]